MPEPRWLEVPPIPFRDEVEARRYLAWLAEEPNRELRRQELRRQRRAFWLRFVLPHTLIALAMLTVAVVLWTT